MNPPPWIHTSTGSAASRSPGAGVKTLTFSVASPGMDGSGISVMPGSPRCAVAAYSVASRTPVHGSGGTGAAKRRSPDRRLRERDAEERRRGAARAGFAAPEPADVRVRWTSGRPMLRHEGRLSQLMPVRSRGRHRCVGRRTARRRGGRRLSHRDQRSRAGEGRGLRRGRRPCLPCRRRVRASTAPAGRRRPPGRSARASSGRCGR